jgi:phosphoglycolate phosphatase-like HAD superfamily hydrolase
MIYVFDFDGVICDSANECMVVAWNAWQKWNNRVNYRYKISQFPNQDKEYFYSARPRVRGAGEYYILYRAQDEGIHITTQFEYENCYHKWDENLSKFKDLFYEERKRLRESNPKKWINLHSVWHEVISLLKKLNFHENLYIATLKDHISVNIILEHFGLQIPAQKIYDQGKIKSKIEALIAIQTKLSIDAGEIMLIDDNITHLIEPHLNGYRAMLSNWGDQSNEYISEATKKGIGILSLLDIAHIADSYECK